MTKYKTTERILEGKIALITGAAGGIGASTAQLFLEQGASVVLVDNNERKLKDTESKLRALHNSKLLGYVADIGNRDQCEKITMLSEANLGGVIDILVNNAGIDRSEEVKDLKLETWREVLQVNLDGSLFMTQCVVKRLREQSKPGNIIFVTSVHTAMAFKNAGAYDVSKHGMVGLMRAAALENARYGIRCNAVAPGAIYPTGLTEDISAETVECLEKLIPIQRWGTPREVANIILFVASDLASYITGSEIRVDGGMSIQNPFNDY
ncbi:MAG: SDR family oxidoreductase [bacterium]|nr:SDR family oxidoreductase [bacterium]